MSAEQRFYEWLLSDHPAAARERERRRLDNQLAEATDLARLQAWLAKIDRLAATGQPIGDSVWRLAAQARSRLIPNARQRLADLSGADDQQRIRQARQDLETSQRVGHDPDYRYPARYQGWAATRQPIPTDPSARVYDPEERPSLGERVSNALEDENGPFGFVRAHTITHRARLAVERAERARPAGRHDQHPRSPLPPAERPRPHRARPAWDRERDR